MLSHIATRSWVGRLRSAVAGKVKPVVMVVCSSELAEVQVAVRLLSDSSLRGWVGALEEIRHSAHWEVGALEERRDSAHWEVAAAGAARL